MRSFYTKFTSFAAVCCVTNMLTVVILINVTMNFQLFSNLIILVSVFLTSKFTTTGDTFSIMGLIINVN